MQIGLLTAAEIVIEILTAQMEADATAKTRSECVRAIAYCVLTIAVAFEVVAREISDILRM